MESALLFVQGENLINVLKSHTKRLKCMHANTFSDHPSKTTLDVPHWLVPYISTKFTSKVFILPERDKPTLTYLFIYLHVKQNVIWHIYRSKTGHIATLGFTALKYVHFIRNDSQILALRLTSGKLKLKAKSLKGKCVPHKDEAGAVRVWM